MKRFALFAGMHYYPNGGWEDFRGSFDSIEETKEFIGNNDWFQIVDFTVGEIVCDNLVILERLISEQ